MLSRSLSRSSKPSVGLEHWKRTLIQSKEPTILNLPDNINWRDLNGEEYKSFTNFF